MNNLYILNDIYRYFYILFNFNLLLLIFYQFFVYNLIDNIIAIHITMYTIKNHVQNNNLIPLNNIDSVCKN